MNVFHPANRLPHLSRPPRNTQHLACFRLDSFPIICHSRPPESSFLTRRLSIDPPAGIRYSSFTGCCLSTFRRKGYSMDRSRLLAAVSAILLVFTACGDSDDVAPLHGSTYSPGHPHGIRDPPRSGPGLGQLGYGTGTVMPKTTTACSCARSFLQRPFRGVYG